MPFIRKKEKISGKIGRSPLSRKKKIWRVALLFCGLILVTTVSYVAFLVASGSKAFENGLNGRSLIKSLYSKEQLKGQSEDRVNILLIGMGGPNHPGGLLTDSIMVMSIRPSDKKVAILSVPRDLLVSIPGHGSDKINSAYADGYNDYYEKNCNKKNASTCKDNALTAGSKLSVDTISKVLDIPIHYYITADFTGFEKVIDTLGGVDIYVDKAISDPTFPADDMVHYAPFKISVGQHHLDGKTALKYARSRETTSDFDRARRQQQIISAAKDKAMTAGFLTNPKKIADVASTLGESIRTSFAPSGLKTFLDMMSGISTDDAITAVLTNGPDGLLTDFNNGTYYLKPKSGNFKEIQNFERNIFDNKKKETAKIEIENASKTSGIGNLLAKDLQGNGYTISSITTAKQKSTKTVIYDFTSGSKKMTLDILKNKLNSEVIKSDRKPGQLSDIRIVLGDDYSKKLD